MNIQKITLKTKDKVDIVGNFSDVEDAKAVVLLLHMMPATKESWVDFSGSLNDAGISTLAIDLRGHGESSHGPNNYKSFIDEEHQASRLDVDSALVFLQKKYNNIYVAGASIGANLTIDALSRYPEIKKGIVLSAGTDYKGIKTLPLAKSLNPDQSLYLIASKDDSSVPNNDKMNEEIFKATSSKKELKIFETGGHGTNILSAHPDLTPKLTTWLKF